MSMMDNKKLDFVKEATKVFLKKFEDKHQLSLVTTFLFDNKVIKIDP